MGILVTLDALFEPAGDVPRAIASAETALERLGWVGRPIVLVGTTLGERRLPLVDDDRLAWARHTLGDTAIRIVLFDPPAEERHADDHAAVTAWRELRGSHEARWLIHDGGPLAAARRAGLTVIAVGGRSVGGVERADHDARDLLDAANHVLMTEAFRPRVTS